VVLCGIFRYLLIYEGLSELHWSVAAPSNDGELLTGPRWILRSRQLGVGLFGGAASVQTELKMLRNGIAREHPALRNRGHVRQRMVHGRRRVEGSFRSRVPMGTRRTHSYVHSLLAGFAFGRVAARIKITSSSEKAWLI